MPVGARQRLGWVQQGHRRDHAGDQGGIGPEAADPESAGCPYVVRAVAKALPRVGQERVPGPVHGQHHEIDKQPLSPQGKRPEKGHALQVTEKQRRVADREQAATAVADQKDEEDRRVDHLPPLPVGLQQRPNQQHRRAGGADETRRQRTEPDEGRIDGGRGFQIPLDPHATGDRVDGEEQENEGYVFGTDSVDEHGARQAPGGPARPW